MAAKKKSSSKTPTGKTLVIVESPAKARTISKFLGDAYEVLASIGHIRDLPTSTAQLPPEYKGSKYGRLGVDLENDFTPIYVVPPAKKDQIKTLKAGLKNAPELLLATDEDREGEAISWHLMEVLKPKVPSKRLVFHEITKTAIAHALNSAREIDIDLVKAQETRRILDRLFGYEVSPVLWRKIRPRLSAGRVQSVALRIIVEREEERMAFHSSEYWDLSAVLAAQDNPFEALLTELGGKRIASGRDFDPATGKLKSDDSKVAVLDGPKATALAEKVAKSKGVVRDVEEKPYQERPAAPFTTSTLQQEAGRKLRFPAKRTMRIAQQLYENGCITYMRTDSTSLSDEAVTAAVTLIEEQYGKEYLPKGGRRTYKTKVKNAQEAHEAIRPAGSSFRNIADVRKEFGKDAGTLYELIWKRTVASQMPNATGMRITVRVAVDDALFRAGGKTISFPGFRRAYVEGSDDPNAELADQERILPAMKVGDEVAVRTVEPKQHVTQPPARYTEASLVKELDTRGIGRPSTWASIIGVLLDREYAFKRSTALVPSFTAFAVVRMLKGHFGQVLDYDFTANMEDDLDSISRGEMNSKEYLRKFYLGNGQPGLKQLVEDGIENVNPREVCAFPLGNTEDGREIEVRVGKYGLFITDGEHNASLVEDTVPDELTVADAEERIAQAAKGPQALGQDPATDQPVYVKTGRFGPYVQLGDMEEGGDKPKMVSLLQGMSPDTIDLATALRLLELPRNLGEYAGEPAKVEPAKEQASKDDASKDDASKDDASKDDASKDETPKVEAEKVEAEKVEATEADPAKVEAKKVEPAKAEPVFAHLGRYGPYVKWGSESRSIPADIPLLDINLEQAIVLLKQPRRRRGQAAPAEPLRILGKHPTTEVELKILKGRYGPYVTDGDINASLPKDMEPTELTIDDAVVLLVKRAERIAAGGGRRKKKKASKKKAKKKSAKKKAAKKKATKKKAAKKKAAKKKAAAKKPPAEA